MKIKTQSERHYEIISYAILHKASSLRTLDFAICDYEQDKVLFIYGSNEPKDWYYNFAYIGVLFHLGYYLLARRLNLFCKGQDKIILVGHSLGAGVASVLYWLARKQIKEMILLACPPSYTIINPLIPKNTTNYRAKGDIIGGVKWLKPLFRQPCKITWLPSTTSGVKQHYLASYLNGLKKISEKLK